MMLHRFASRAAWEVARRDLAEAPIAGSDIAAIMGAEGRSPWTVWARHHRPDAVRVTPELQAVFDRGHDLEPGILAMYGRRQPGTVPTPHTIAQHDAHPWALGSPDGLVFDDTDGADPVGGVDAKSAGATSRDWLDADGADGVPDGPYWQACWYMAIVGVPWWDIAVLLGPRLDLRVYRIPRLDDTAEQAMIAKAADWRARFLLGTEIPPFDHSDTCLQSVRRPQSAPLRVATDAEGPIVAEFLAARAAAKLADARLGAAKAALVATIGEAEGLDCGGQGRVLTYRTQPGARRVDLDGIRAEAPDLVARHTTPGEPIRVLRVGKGLE